MGILINVLFCLLLKFIGVWCIMFSNIISLILNMFIGLKFVLKYVIVFSVFLDFKIKIE